MSRIHRVLIVDGHPSVRMLFTIHLTSLGYMPNALGEFDAALRTLEHDPEYAFVFANLASPPDEGRTVAGRYPSLPIVAASQYRVDYPEARKSLAAGARVFLEAPVSVEDVRAGLVRSASVPEASNRG